ncbi:MAG TPA: capsule assembly Wzi family protein [Longimicrobium sp.]|nr:capsule assembly Wzi family protein [Longimicrobium sp.]
MTGARRGWIVAGMMLALPPSLAAAQDTTIVKVDSAAVTRVQVTADTGFAACMVDCVPARPEFRASPLLPFEHWAVQAARRAEAMGLTRFFPAQRAVPRAQVARALDEAAQMARARDDEANGGHPAVRRLAAGWQARFREEFPEYTSVGARTSGGVTVLGAHAAGGYDRWAGRLAPAIGYLSSRQDPRALGDVSDPRATLETGIATSWASVSAEGAYRGGEAVLRRWDAAVGFGAFQLGVGRAQVGYGWGRTGGIVYSTPDAMPRVELQSTRPFHLPWVFRKIGPVTLHTFAGPVNDPARHPTNPNLWGMRVAVQPHPRLTLGANRGSMFGGEGDPITVKNLASMLAGVIRSNFENQVVSLDARYRLPTDRVLPATAYVEWGADDAAGAFDETPGRVIGLFLPALPSAPQVGVGTEYTYFKHWCCGHGPWYLNFTFPGNWAVRGRPLGHPLGGEGSEYAAYAQADLWDARLRVDARGWIRDRSDRSLNGGRYNGGGNLFTPGRAGRSRGGSVEAALRLLPRAELRGAWVLDDGGGWREQSLGTSLAWTF